MEHGNGGRIVTRAVFAENCGITEKSLRMWITVERMPSALPDGRIEVRPAHKWVVARQAERVAAQAGGKGARAAILRAKERSRAELAAVIDDMIGTLRTKGVDPKGPWDAETAQAVMRATRDDTVDGLLLHTDDDEKTFKGRLMASVESVIRRIELVCAMVRSLKLPLAR